MTKRGKVVIGCTAAVATIAMVACMAISSTETVPSASIAETAAEDNKEDEWHTYTATAYCSCEKCCGIYAKTRPTDAYGNELVYTASGSLAIQGRTIAADWSILPCGTVIEIAGYGTYEVQDRGGAIIGNKIDVYFDNHQDALDFGVRPVQVRINKIGGERT